MHSACGGVALAVTDSGAEAWGRGCVSMWMRRDVDACKDVDSMGMGDYTPEGKRNG